MVSSVCLPGLAIYNSHILEFSFPSVLFKKLTGQRPTFADLAELHPEVSLSLQKLLDYPGDVADLGLFCQVCLMAVQDTHACG